MKNLLKKLHIVQDQDISTATSEQKQLLGIPGWFYSVTGGKLFNNSPPASTSSISSAFPPNLGVDMDGDGVMVESGRKGSTLDDEEYQLQLAIELSTKEDPEATQIEAVKQISLGSFSRQNSPSEVLAYRYWNYNALSFDDMILDGFYDLHGILSESSTLKMPSLVDLQGLPTSGSINWEAILVNRSEDPDLLKLEQKALVMALDSRSGSLGSAGSHLVQKLAVLVAEYMGGAVRDRDNILKSWSYHSNSLRTSLGNVILPLGRLTFGLARHRALLFKVLADSVAIPCQLLKGKQYTGSDDGAMNIIRLNDGREWIVDLMTDPGTLIASDSLGAQKEYDDNSFASSLSIGDAESSRALSCGSSACSTSSYSSSSGTTDKTIPFCKITTSGSDINTRYVRQDDKNKKHNTVTKEFSPELSNDKSKKSNSLMNSGNLKTSSNEGSRKLSYTYALARSPSWTEGISAPAVRRMKVKDVSQYMIYATKENPQLAQKLHDVLLESGVVVPPNLFTEVCTENREPPVSEGKNLFDLKNKINKESDAEDRMKIQASGGLSADSRDQNVNSKVVPLRSHLDHLKPVVGLGVQHPLDMVPCYSQCEESSMLQQATPGKLTDNLPVAAAVATAAIVASSMVAAASKSNAEGSIDVPVAAAATAAAVVATTAVVSKQHEQLLPCGPLLVIPDCNFTELPQSTAAGSSLEAGQKESDAAQKVFHESSCESSEIHHETGSGSSKSESTNSVKSDVSFDDVAEFEIAWEELILGERIGLGSYGEVYRGDWHGTEVAVKKFLEQDLSNDALEEFKTEVRIMKRLRHPNVVLFMGAVTRVPNLSIVTEFLPRGSLFRLIHRPNNQLDERRRLKMALDVARGMNYLHTCSPVIVHRDLKSPNLLVDKNWVVKVGDFGLSRIKHNTFLSSRSTAGTDFKFKQLDLHKIFYIHSGAPVGWSVVNLAEWMAPEVLRNEPSDEKCDVYSFGVILWELCTFRQPWGGMNPMQVVGAVGFQHRRLDIPHDMDPVIADIVLKCWQTDPTKRPSFSELMAMLLPLQRSTASTPVVRQRITS